MPFYVGDYLADTSRLTPLQHGLYLLLILDYWRNGAPPDDDAVLSQIVRTPAKEWAKHRTTMAAYFRIDGGKWNHKRIAAEIVGAVERKKKAAAKAEKAAAVRWGKDAPSSATSNAPSIGQALHEECPSPSPSSIKSKAEQKPAAEAPPGVRSELWAEWCRSRRVNASTGRLQAKFLAECGGDPNAIIEQSMRQQWKGLFAMKGDGPGKSTERARVTNEIWNGVRNEPTDITDITGQSERVA